MRTLTLSAAVLSLLLPRALAAQAAPAAKVEVHGHVVDATTGRPVEGAMVALDDVGSRALADTAGSFVLQNVPTGEHDWVISRVGYARWQESAEVAEGDEFTIAVLPRPEVLEGITAVASQLETRRRASGESVRALDGDLLRLSGAPTAVQLVHDQLGLSTTPCPGTGEPDCSWVRGELVKVAVFVDEQPVGGMSALASYRPQDLYTVEAYAGGQMLRVITHWYAERLARRRASLTPIHFY